VKTLGHEQARQKKKKKKDKAGRISVSQMKCYLIKYNIVCLSYPEVYLCCNRALAMLVHCS
jgi:hypothetical protein